MENNKINISEFSKELSGLVKELMPEKHKNIVIHEKEIFMINDQKFHALCIEEDEETHGAAALFYPGIREQIAGILEQNYYVLPTSLHDLFIVPESLGIETEALCQMLREGNSMANTANEFLSNNVYKYSVEEKRLINVTAGDADGGGDDCNV